MRITYVTRRRSLVRGGREDNVNDRRGVEWSGVEWSGVAKGGGEEEARA
jgi:hypothetical protein